RENLISKAEKIVSKIYAQGIISNFTSKNTSADGSVIVIDKNIAQEREISDFCTASDIEKTVSLAVQQSFNNNSKDYAFLTDIIVKNLPPNIVYNKEKTDGILASQIDDISLLKGMVSKNDNIISKGELITEEKYQILSSLRAEYEGAEKSFAGNFLANLGQYLLVVISLGAMVLFVYNTDKSIFLNNKKILLIYTVILLMSFMTMFIMHFNQEYLYVVPLCLTPILIRTFFDTKVSLYVFLVSIIIIGFSVPNSFEFVFYQLIVGMMAILSVEHLEKRAEFFNTALIVFFTYSFIYFAMTLIQSSDIKQLDINRFIYFAINAILILFAFPIVFILEKMFGLVSEMSLMEYCNTNTKILRELSAKAPGTFQHSIQVANIAEDVIHQIGGNSLLVRAGSLHHDIGKIMMPMFFIENQNSNINPLNEMSNSESSQTIISHVSNGIKLAHKYKLPEPIVDFIRTHHGTSATKYFYNKEVNEHPNREVDVKRFSYKGPRPFSKETSVLMMVDSVEAASRAMKERTEESISNLVDNIIDGQIKDHQHDNAEITFSDIDKIKKILKRKLQSIYHVRIEYPVNKKEKQQ
ncbi:MAG: HDIG domain-containing protein, partial [Bacteroidales bacterium]|nr:HDIG domain-containing protein [Bacteroidales bacterium]